MIAEIHEKITKDVVIEIDTNLHGMIIGNIDIKKTAIFNVYGMINGSIVIEKGAFLKLHGIVTGKIINNGNCEIYGTVNGEIQDISNKTFIDENAIINSKI